jgi:hypothetical protein
MYQMAVKDKKKILHSKDLQSIPKVKFLV